MFEGTLKKMITERAEPIQYFLELSRGFIHLNNFLDQQVSITHTGSQCLNCHQELPIFRQGFCKSCFFEIPAAGDWVMRPELSKAHLDQEDRNLDYEKKMQLQPHIIYLALSSHLKVGVTRKSQVPTRWIDQGAHQAMVLLEVPNRYLAGIGEVALKEVFSDKTNWRKMVQNEAEPVYWDAVFEKALDHLPKELKPYMKPDERHLEKMDFPVLHYPLKAQSLNLTKTPFYQGKLMGIRGQYLLFEDQTVFNIRSNEGQKIKFQPIL